MVNDRQNTTTDYWSVDESNLFAELRSTREGISDTEAADRLKHFGPNRFTKSSRTEGLFLFFAQFKSPITLLLLGCAILSVFLRDQVDAAIILTIVVASAMLGFIQERGAALALSKLLSLVRVRASVLRNGAEKQVETEEIVPGDLLVLSAGTTIAADARIIEANNLFVNEASFTGETFPVEKSPSVIARDSPLNERRNIVLSGTYVVSGVARALVCRTGKATEFGKLASRLRTAPPETEFERGIRQFGFFLVEITMLLIVALFGVNVYFHRPALESLMFSLALAVGLTPQLLPAIISVNLATGARRMAMKDVIVRRLESIENFGSMTVLCSDKTGTLTEGTVEYVGAFDSSGRPSSLGAELAFINAYFENGFVNPIDEAIRRSGIDAGDYQKLGEIPYDFIRKRLSIIVQTGATRILITKGAVQNVLSICTTAQSATKERGTLDLVRSDIIEQFEKISRQGNRTLAVAYRELSASEELSPELEHDLTFVTLLVLCDPPKKGMPDTLQRLQERGIALKMITGDNRNVAQSIAREVGLQGDQILTGHDLHGLGDEALVYHVRTVSIFAEIEPNQKERIILALKKSGEVVGYMGDGINDATAIRAADVGISVDQAVDVAKEAADIVLLRHDLNALLDGVEEGRKTFANTLKYVFMATSANFGNMFSMAGASLFLPFLPLLPKQILLTNLLTDLPEMTIARDRVDGELLLKPRRWNIGFIRRFMLVFGLLSSVFDYLTFGVLIWLLGAGETEFRTGWFAESVISASLVVLVVRTRRSIWNSMPSPLLLGATIAVIGITLYLPFSPFAPVLSLEPLPMNFLIALTGIVVCYILSAELMKGVFYRWLADDPVQKSWNRHSP
jgi:Mg2+-importing ATPase